MYKRLIRVSDTYYMIMADRFKSFFAINKDSQWRVSTIDLYELYPREVLLQVHNSKNEAIAHLKYLNKHWNLKDRTKLRKVIS